MALIELIRDATRFRRDVQYLMMIINVIMMMMCSIITIIDKKERRTLSYFKIVSHEHHQDNTRQKIVTR